MNNDTMYLVANDDAVGVSFYKRHSPMVYWTQGPAFLMMFSNFFYEREKLRRRMISLGAVSVARKFQKAVQKYDLVLANSKTSATLCAFLLDRSPEGVVYPPIDTKAFKSKLNVEKENKYALWIAKRDYTYGQANLISKLAERIRVKIVGNVHIAGAETLGRVGDEQLQELYQNAYVTLYPNWNEIFGYIPLESMACGTPVIAYNGGGPSESIVDRETGWLVHSEKELVRVAENLFLNEYPLEIRSNCRFRAEQFSIESTVKEFYGHLQRVYHSQPARTSE